MQLVSNLGPSEHSSTGSSKSRGLWSLFKAVISGQEIHFVGYGFVNDAADLIVTAKSSSDSLQSVIEQYNRAPWIPGQVESESLVVA
jgi:hypothetical protein